MASEAQKPLAKTEFLLVCGQLATVSLEPCIKVHNFFPSVFEKYFYLQTLKIFTKNLEALNWKVSLYK